MLDKSNIALFASAISLVILGTAVPGLPTYWSWPLAFLGLMLMMYVIAPNAGRRGK